MDTSIKLPASWKTCLEDVFTQPYMQDLKVFLQNQLTMGKTIYPRPSEYFQAFYSLDFNKVKVVILGQDPYHGAGQAHGLCFSVRPSVEIPPSLNNIYTELERDLHIPKAQHGCLSSWARQGVLLLNSVLTVEARRPGSHQNKGWELFTDQVIRKLNEDRKDLVFLLWGGYAFRKGSFIDTEKHLVLKAPHPSPLSAARGFFGCSHFSKTNNWLKQKGMTPIHWELPPVKEVVVSFQESK